MLKITRNPRAGYGNRIGLGPIPGGRFWGLDKLNPFQGERNAVADLGLLLAHGCRVWHRWYGTDWMKTKCEVQLLKWIDTTSEMNEWGKWDFIELYIVPPLPTGRK